MTSPTILSIGGLDPTGGAGVVADAAMIRHCGGVPRTLLSCVTVQSRHGFERLESVPSQWFRESFAAVLAHGPVHAVKVGLLPGASTLELVFELLAECLPSVPAVVDPVLSATAGGLQSKPLLVDAYRGVMSQVAVLTPNRAELEELAEGAEPARELLELGADAVLCTGGDEGHAQVRDELWTEQGCLTFERDRIDCGPVHGTGCALSSAVATKLASGVDLHAACREATDLVAQCLAGMRPASDGLPEDLRL